MRKWVFVFMVVAAVIGDVRSAAAADQARCFSDWWNCQYEAAVEETFWRRTLKGLDCELAFYGCLREQLMG